MKKLVLIPVLMLLTLTITAQRGESALPKGHQQINFGLGFNTTGFPVYVGVDFAVHNNVTIGPLLKMRFEDNYTNFFLLGKVDYHWNSLMGIPSNFDFYTGGNIGARFHDGTHLSLGLQIGGRWYWSDRMGLNLELGGGAGFGVLFGLSVRL